MKKFISVVIVILGITLASLQQYSWIKTGAYKDADALQVLISILWSCTIITVVISISKSINKSKTN